MRMNQITTPPFVIRAIYQLNPKPSFDPWHYGNSINRDILSKSPNSSCTCSFWKIVIRMLSGHAISLHEGGEENEHSLEDPVADVHDEEDEVSGNVLHRASFDELARNHVQYDTVIWVLISLLLVLAWGVGVIMLLYLPVRRFVLQKDISSRKLYVTANKIVYKATRPSFLPFLGFTKIEKRIPLHLVIDIILEQGCLQSIYGLHTFRIGSIAHGKASPVDELQFQGVSYPKLLRKVIITEAAKSIREVRSWEQPKIHLVEGDSGPSQTRSLSALNRLQSPSGKFIGSPRHAHLQTGVAVPDELLLHKLEEVEQSVKKIESLIGGLETQDDLPR
ncbi:hypothetical protein J5N97_024007 [Dioscorea zingiberensis]|uniref:DUF7642 domain-containing protein n=1 Tax=Dioscorea zingiberensis TaxID=325984 RepID=A0A9D5C687_9LILI|nr:hypothetical protein J5N97_024007 [Dioscorea zingiberensis]